MCHCGNVPHYIFILMLMGVDTCFWDLCVCVRTLEQISLCSGICILLKIADVCISKCGLAGA